MQSSNEQYSFNNKVTTVSFILAITVMFIHSENIALYENSHLFVSILEYLISHSIGDLAVPTFFMISSYLFYRNFHSNQILNKYKSRIRSIFFPYLLWNSLYFIIFYIITLFPTFRTFMTTEQFALSPQLIWEAVFFHKYNNVFWFMQQLIYFIALSPLVYYLLKGKSGIMLVIICLVIGIYCPMFPNIWYGVKFNMMVYWFLGCYFAIHKPSLFEKAGKENFVSLSVFICIILLIIRFLLDYVLGNLLFFPILSPILLFINVPFFWFALSSFIPSKTPWWMQITFFIYAAHPLLVDAWKKASAYFLPDNSFLCLANYVLAVIVSFIIIIISAKLLIKFLPKLWTALNGGRTPTF